MASFTLEIAQVSNMSQDSAGKYVFHVTMLNAATGQVLNHPFIDNYTVVKFNSLVGNLQIVIPVQDNNFVLTNAIARVRPYSIANLQYEDVLINNLSFACGITPCINLTLASLTTLSSNQVAINYTTTANALSWKIFNIGGQKIREGQFTVVGNNQTISFANLAIGSYTLIISGVNCSGVVSQTFIVSQSIVLPTTTVAVPITTTSPITSTVSITTTTAPLQYNTVLTYVLNTQDADQAVTGTVISTNPTAKFEFNFIANRVGLPQSMVLNYNGSMYMLIDYMDDYNGQPFRLTVGNGTTFNGVFTNGTLNY